MVPMLSELAVERGAWPKTKKVGSCGQGRERYSLEQWFPDSGI